MLLIIVFTLTSCTVSQKNVKSSNASTSILTNSEDEVLNKESAPIIVKPEANIAQSLRRVLESTKEPMLTQEIITLFYDYYSDYYNTFTADFVTHNKELRFLPSFEKGSVPNWDELTHFIYYFADSTEKNGKTLINKSTFENTVRIYFPDFKYSHKSSQFLKLLDKYYTPTGWDDHGEMYYKLNKLKKDSHGTFTASFEGFYIEEDVWNECPSENLRIVQEKSYEQGFNGNQLAPHELKEVIRKLILDSNYSRLFTVNETVEIQFELSKDSKYPLRYVSCQRSIINNN